ncbi:hypothetical protein A3H80_03745 [Candidatus Roizmanbacteria bacterium RIFCSPLOWO2_02_FULL_37_19]|uniref:Peptidase C60 sortase A and B n=1 Tax=Candidatus Roizmanbacteria bacterium RIFCSPHIGHO2_02_FULL_37_24 TaxID=1802037 RepID=A0A1F7GVD4_9BACT|nr:MAG: hypothetical protein A2862_01835 [Candidatus Roizmanbacteria bacterium RIFCSPHIGHO2_01_FULL_38_41]OGK22918.1 MAG: hypothetical protein A3C24_03595 [Candidatus Roizmanbacteria bacterium RIFCSPHIGHO2_02_FULL_37_24]OGK33628.1 MAG: hypothetical protein A3E10_05190 [Candidatus Roizmanbacteria bacterium RIFCSPHIGHO2_12_FULL_37_23]OGK44977.1 MAG: hypothetical protein A2956_00340 [Candidatus Roizmanbacteria bacterium RIFCSPLOWO2_01_FULL_37_57]OGK55280.1 MAG: hypothetical protein A3H80_03745 [Ca
MEFLNKIVELNTKIIYGIFLVLIIAIFLPPTELTILKTPLGNKKGEVAGVFAKDRQDVETVTHNLPLPSPQPSPTEIPTPIQVEPPAKIEIPVIGVDSLIQYVGITPEHVMEIPKDFEKVGWYEHSVRPGEYGAAIVNGHFDRTDGSPAVFYNLALLEPGDAIIVTTENGLKLTFNVIELQSYPLDTFPAEYVYGDYEGTALRLITCDGVWNSIKKSYSERLVVVSELVKEGVLN